MAAPQADGRRRRRPSFFTPLVSSSDHTGSKFNLPSRNQEALEDIARLCVNPFHSQAQKNSHPCAKSILASAVDFYCLCRWSLTDLNSSGLACELKKGVGSRNSSEGREDGRGRSREECATCEQLPSLSRLKISSEPTEISGDGDDAPIQCLPLAIWYQSPSTAT